jgi:23S rRNA (adenine2503-C2)-methyltransferase
MDLEVQNSVTAVDATGRPCVLDYSLAELEHLMEGWGQPAYRARQLWEWMYKHYAPSYADMRTLPKLLRDRLEAETVLDPLTLEQEWVSDDRLTYKGLFRLQDGLEIESVLLLHPSGNAELDAGEEPLQRGPARTRRMPGGLPAPASRPRETVCVSTQVGCAVGCPFCATGYSGFSRNLSAGEIVAQVRFFARHPAVTRLTNVVFMGQGEPLANFDAVWKAVETLNSPYGFGIGAKHITISTSGVVPRILELAEKPLHVRLAVSLHAPNDALRDRLVPLNRRWPIRELLAACRQYIERTQRRVTFEYILIEGINDDLALADELAALLRGMPCHVNLIPMNPIAESDWHRPSTSRVLAFQRVLLGHGINTTVRGEKGDAIEAACGQLRNRDEAARARAARRMQKLLEAASPHAAVTALADVAAEAGDTGPVAGALGSAPGSAAEQKMAGEEPTAPSRRQAPRREPAAAHVRAGRGAGSTHGRAPVRSDAPATARSERPSAQAKRGEPPGSVREETSAQSRAGGTVTPPRRRRSPRDYAEQEEAARRARYGLTIGAGTGRQPGIGTGSSTRAPRAGATRSGARLRAEEGKAATRRIPGPAERSGGRARGSGPQQSSSLLREVKQARGEHPDEQHAKRAKRGSRSRPRSTLKRT